MYYCFKLLTGCVMLLPYFVMETWHVIRPERKGWFIRPCFLPLPQYLPITPSLSPSPSAPFLSRLLAPPLRLVYPQFHRYYLSCLLYDLKSIFLRIASYAESCVPVEFPSHTYFPVGCISNEPAKWIYCSIEGMSSQTGRRLWFLCSFSLSLLQRSCCLLFSNFFSRKPQRTNTC